MDIQIVPMTEQHFEGYYSCMDVVARERRYLGFLEAPELEASRRWVLSNIKKDAPCFVAVDNEIVVGWCDIQLRTTPGFTHRGELGMGLLPKYREKGIGVKLMTAALRKAGELGLERVELKVFASNTRARRLYEKFGFVLEGQKKEARKLDGVYDDVVEMALFLTQWEESA